MVGVERGRKIQAGQGGGAQGQEPSAEVSRMCFSLDRGKCEGKLKLRGSRVQAKPGALEPGC